MAFLNSHFKKRSAAAWWVKEGGRRDRERERGREKNAHDKCLYNRKDCDCVRSVDNQNEKRACVGVDAGGWMCIFVFFPYPSSSPRGPPLKTLRIA